MLSISESGILAGTVESLEGSTQSGFIRKQHGEDKVFSHPNARSTTVVRGVNNRGLVTGYRDARFFVYGFIYDPVRDDFTDIPLGWLAIAQGINSQGEVVGSGLNAPSNICPEFIDRDFSFFRAVDGSMKYFQVNGWRTRARGINDAGAIAGWAVDPDSGQIKSFVVSLDGSDCQSITVPTADLVEFPESYNTIAQGITNSGMISGQVENFDDNGNLIMRGFVAQPQ